MREIFNFTLSFFIMVIIVLCVISSDEVYAVGKDGAGQSSLVYVGSFSDDFDADMFEENIDRNTGDIASNMTPNADSHTSVSSAGKDLRAGMVDRKKTIIIDYKIDTSELDDNDWLSDLCEGMMNYAFIHTGVPDEGDSLKFNVRGYKANASYLKYKDYTYVTIVYKISYYTTAAQEEKLNQYVDALKSDLKLDNKTDYDKVKAIYKYICDNVAYDNSSNILKYSAYNALVNKSAVCQGYSVLFYRLALEYGIDARVISGTGRNGCHAWNIVELDGKYYNADTTWDADEEKYSYFLKGTYNFDEHKSDSKYLTSSFKKEYPVCESNYKCTTHKWKEEYTVDKTASYAADGSKSIHCSVCDAKNQDSITVIPKRVCNLAAPTSVKTQLTNYYSSTGGYDDLKIVWDKVEGASGYCIKYKSAGSDKWSSKYTINRYIYIANLSDGVKYTVRVYPYVTENNAKYLSGNYKEAQSVYTLKKVKGVKLNKNLSGKVTVKWSGIEGETGYQIYRSKTKNGKYTKVTSVKLASSKTPTVKINAAKKTTYWYKVRSYKKVGENQYVYGPWSEKIKFTK